VTEETYISISYAFEEVFGEITVFVKWWKTSWSSLRVGSTNDKAEKSNHACGKKIKRATDPSIIGVCSFFDVLFIKKIIWIWIIFTPFFIKNAHSTATNKFKTRVFFSCFTRRSKYIVWSNWWRIMGVNIRRRFVRYY
jgi:hypothetical protein